MKLPRILLVALLSLLASSLAGAQTYRNIVNDRWGTVSNGPQSALIVDVPRGSSAARTDAAIAARLRARWKATSRATLPPPRAATRAAKREYYPMSTVVAVREGGKLVLKAPTRAVGGGTLNFVFTGFNGAQVLASNGNPVVVEDFLRTLLLGDGSREGLYNKIVRLYGQPAWTGTVEVRSLGFYESNQATDPQRQLFGAYDVSNNRILLPLYNALDTTAHAFLLNVLHAFHGPAVFQYDAWEQGFIRAAATVIARDPQLGFLDPTANFYYTLLPRYDALNQPALAGPRFVPPSQENVGIDGRFTVGKMIWARMAMSGAAWLKCYIENPDFFKNFNAAYYARFDPVSNPGVAGNVPELKAIAASVLPSVEGLPFADWFARQYALDTAVTPGAKLFAFVFPSEPDTQGQQSATVALVYYRTTFDAATRRDDELLLGGRAYATYFDGVGARLPSGGAQGDFAQIEEGEGALTATFTVGEGVEIGRLTMDFAVGSESVRTYLPFGVGGDVQVVGLGASAGSVTASQGTVPGGISRAKTATFANRAFGVTFGGSEDELYQSQFVVDDGGVQRVFRKNLGDGRSFVVLPAPNGAGTTVTLSKTFERNPNAEPHLISPPLRPLASSVEEAIGLPTSDYLISAFDATTGGYETLTPGLPSAPALAPGRGLWFKYAPLSGSGAVRLRLTGVAPPTDTDFTIAARYGWNLIGSPFDLPVALSTLRVKLQDREPLTWDEAVEARLVLKDVFAFDPASGYAPVSSLEQWKGYWVRVLAPTGVVLLLPGPDSPTRAVRMPATRATRSGGAGWSVRLVASQSAPNLPFGGIARASFGGASGASEGIDPRFDTLSPPEILDGLTISLGERPPAGGGRLVGDFRDLRAAGRATWHVSITSPKAGPVRLRWEGIGSLPRGTRLTLLEGTRRVPLTQAAGYTLELKAGETRTLTIKADAALTSPLRIAALQTTGRAQGGGIAVRYTLTQEAEVLAEISTIGGRTVSRLATGRAQAGKEATALWDGRSTGGQPVPAGPYVLTIFARTEDGQTARLSRPVVILR